MISVLNRYPKDERTERAEEIAAALVHHLFVNFKVVKKAHRPRLETERALLLRLPEPGVVYEGERAGKRYSFTVLSDEVVELVLDGKRTRHGTLKGVATAICGYPPSVAGWTFFFGGLSREEVAARYGRRKGD